MLLFDDPYIQRIHENCKKNMKNTPEDWQRVADFFMEQSRKHPEKTTALLECYDRLAADVEHRDASQQ